MTRHTDTFLVKPLPRRRGQSVWLRRALMFATVVVLVNALVGQGGLSESLRARREYAETQARLSALQRENASMAEQMRRLSSDPRTIEGVAREELGWMRPGELMFVLKPVK
jgi:cell division protein FtsB